MLNLEFFRTFLAAILAVLALFAVLGILAILLYLRSKLAMMQRTLSEHFDHVQSLAGELAPALKEIPAKLAEISQRIDMLQRESAAGHENITLEAHLAIPEVIKPRIRPENPQEILKEYHALRQSWQSDHQDKVRLMLDFRALCGVETFSLANRAACDQDGLTIPEFKKQDNGDLWALRLRPEDPYWQILPAADKPYNELYHVLTRWSKLFQTEPAYDGKSTYPDFRVEAFAQLSPAPSGNLRVEHPGRIILGKASVGK